jgi:hypothetical protein
MSSGCETCKRGRKGGRIGSYNSNDVICDLLKCTNFPIIFFDCIILLFFYYAKKT